MALIARTPFPGVSPAVNREEAVMSREISRAPGQHLMTFIALNAESEVGMRRICSGVKILPVTIDAFRTCKRKLVFRLAQVARPAIQIGMAADQWKRRVRVGRG